MNNKIAAFTLSTALVFSSSIYASDILDQNNICRSNADTIFAFFNGVMTPYDLALDNLDKLRNLYGTTSPDGGKIDYDLMYNHTDGYQDLVETFEQRFLEQLELKNRWELFFQVLDEQGSWWDKIILKVPGFIVKTKNWRNILQANFIRKLSAIFAKPPDTIQNYAEHQTKIDNWVLEGKKLLFFAYSQGNLFANSAYTYTTNKVSKDSVKLIHIAPASPITNGPHIFVNQDFIINSLRAFGSVPSITHSIPVYKPFLNNNGRDFFGHGLMTTYMNPAFDMHVSINNYVNKSLIALKAPPVQASQGLFTATLSWDGFGNIDLQTKEPKGSQVYSLNKQGTSGYLDVDNTNGSGSEHYFASCDKTKIATGIYNFSLANDTKADGGKATLQISSDSAGVLATKSVVLGRGTRDAATIDMLNVKVSLDPKTQKHAVSIE